MNSTSESYMCLDSHAVLVLVVLSLFLNGNIVLLRLSFSLCLYAKPEKDLLVLLNVCLMYLHLHA